MNEISEELIQITRITFCEPYFKLINTANLQILDVLSNRVAANYNKMTKLTCSIDNE